MVLLPYYAQLDGLRLPGSFSPDRVKAVLQYKPKDDLFLVTFPKCGTTWMHQILYLIYTDGKPPTNPEEFHRRIPFIEMMGEQCFTDLIKPGALKTHLPFGVLPFSSEAKYIYMARSPKDTCASLYEHTRTIPGYKFGDGKFDDFFEVFINGNTDYNDYFEHILSWYKIRHEQNVLFLNFEELKDNPKATIERVTEFMGVEYLNKIRTDNKIFEDILYHSSFEVMRKSTNDLMRFMVPKDAAPRVPISFVRTGKLGGWRGMFSEEQSKRMDEKICRVFKKTDLPELWKRQNCL